MTLLSETRSEVQRPRRRFWLWLGRVTAIALLLLVVLAIAGLVFQSVASAIDRRDYLPPGRLVDLGGFRLHLLCSGIAKSGRPTVILESGLASPVPIWVRVQNEVGMVTRVCSYDRAGIGWSEAGPQPRDAAHIVAELHVLLEKSGIAGPYVLVGHSSGGLYVRAYQRLYPNSVVGMVLVDSTPEGYHLNTVEGRAENTNITRAFMFVPTLARLGLVRLGPTCRSGLPADFPSRQTAEYRALCSATESWYTERDEHHRLDDPLPGIRQMMHIPLAVITSGQNIHDLASWGRLQRQLTALSTNSEHLVVERASHASFLVDGQDARTTSIEILKVVDSAVSGHKLVAAHGSLN